MLVLLATGEMARANAGPAGASVENRSPVADGSGGGATPSPAAAIGPIVCISVYPSCPPPWTRRSLALAFALTPREADVTLALLDGLSVAQAADRCGLRVKSARVYLSRVFAKTDTGSQARLLARLME